MVLARHLHEVTYQPYLPYTQRYPPKGALNLVVEAIRLVPRPGFFNPYLVF